MKTSAALSLLAATCVASLAFLLAVIALCLTALRIDFAEIDERNTEFVTKLRVYAALNQSEEPSNTHDKTNTKF